MVGQTKPLFIVMLGAPGAGKGTQARMLSEALHVPQVSSGDIFRENLKNQTPLGMLAKTYMDKGELVPDDVTIKMVMDRLGKDDAARAWCWTAFLGRSPRQLPSTRRSTRRPCPFRSCRCSKWRRSADHPAGRAARVPQLPGHVPRRVHASQGRGRVRQVRRRTLPARRTTSPTPCGTGCLSTTSRRLH